MDAREKKRMLSYQTHQLIYSHVVVSMSVGLVGESKVRPKLYSIMYLYPVETLLHNVSLSSRNLTP